MKQHELTKYENIVRTELSKLYPAGWSVSIHTIRRHKDKLYVSCRINIPIDKSIDEEYFRTLDLFLTLDLEDNNKIEIISKEEVNE